MRYKTSLPGPTQRKQGNISELSSLCYITAKNMTQGYYKRPLQISKTDLQKAMSYLADASKLYDALPMQSMKSRAYMIRQLVAKLQKIKGDDRQ